MWASPRPKTAVATSNLGVLETNNAYRKKRVLIRPLSTLFASKPYNLSLTKGCKVAGIAGWLESATHVVGDCVVNEKHHGLHCTIPFASSNAVPCRYIPCSLGLGFAVYLGVWPFGCVMPQWWLLWHT